MSELRVQAVQWWHAQCQRFDALGKRERLLVIGAVAALALMLADTLWLTPAFTAWNAARQHALAGPAQQARDAADAQRVTEMARAQDVLARHELAQLRQRLREGDAAMRAAQSALVGPDRMLGLLEQMLARHGQVRVREMSVLPRTDLAADGSDTAPAKPGTPKPAAAESAGPASLYRHGIELTLEGSFGDLVSYLDALEAMPQRVLWGAMKFRVDQHPRALLTLRVYTLSADRHWLEI